LVIEDKRFFIGALQNYFIEVAPVTYVRYDQESERKMKRNGGRDGMDLAVHLREE
jgi:hypothetical protein